MTTVHNILHRKGRAVVSISSSASVLDALALMAKHNIGALLVYDEGTFKGIFTERDYARRMAVKGTMSHEIPVSQLLTPNVISVTPQTSIDECMQLMTDRRFRHLPVMENGELCGMISIGDVVKEVIGEREETIEQLHNYITGKR